MTEPSGQIVVVGSINNDLAYRVTEFPRPGETIFSLAAFSNSGGKGANQAIAAARSGGQVTMIACLGTDAFGMAYKEELSQADIHTEWVWCLEGEPSGTAVILVNGAGENEIVVNGGANGLLSPQMLQSAESAFDGAGLLLLQNEIPLETSLCAIKAAKSRAVQVIWNPAPASGITTGLLHGVDILIVNETEAASIAGTTVKSDTPWDETAQILHGAGAGKVLITLGAKGVWLSQAGSGALIPGFTVTPLDSTAAGDTFAGALAARLSAGEALENAVTFAQAAAALSVTRQGAQASIPSFEDIQQFMSQV